MKLRTMTSKRATTAVLAFGVVVLSAVGTANAGHLSPDLPVVAEPCKLDTGPNLPSCSVDPKIDIDTELVCTSDTCFFLVTTCLEVNNQEFCSTTQSRPSRR